MKNLVIGFIILQGFTFSLYGQETPSNSDQKPGTLGFKGHSGYIIPHRQDLKDISESSPWGFEINYSNHFITQNTWNQCGCFPRIGMAFHYTNFSNRLELGSAYSAFAFLEPFLMVRSRFQPSFRLGFGLSYLNQVYHPVTNPRNVFYSTPLSFIMIADLNLRYVLNEKFNLLATGSYPHISNGGAKQPNKGINFPKVAIGMEYNFQPVKFPEYSRQTSVDEMHPKRWILQSQIFFSRKDVVENEEKYTVSGLYVGAGRIVSRLSALQLGFELVHDASLREKQNRNLNENYRPYHWATVITHDLLMGKFIFSQGLGVYGVKPSEYSNLLYQRIGLQYKIMPRVIAGLNMKVHTSVADFVDFRIGYRW
jgi:hypothetical protein